jgi:4'-phosphopantetheinyl transferase
MVNAVAERINFHHTEFDGEWELKMSPKPGHLSVVLETVESIYPVSSASHQSATPKAKPVGVFLCQPDSIKDPVLLAEYRELLDEEERGRLARYRNPADAHAFLASHALVRTALSEFAGQSPKSWCFRRSQYGRPEIDPPGAHGLQFNLAHTRELVGCIVSRGAEVGIDLELPRHLGDLLAIAHRFFAQEEAALLRTLPPEKQAPRFFSVWTLKEAYAKARGMGLSLPLQRIRFEIERGEIKFQIASELEDDSAEWSFALLRTPAGHLVAIAVRRPGLALGRMMPKWLVPLTHITPSAECEILAATR